MKIKPLNDWAVIIPSEAMTRTAGGLFIPETAKEKPAEGIVEAIGPGALEEEERGRKKEKKKERKFIPTSVKPGERVMYDRYAGQKIIIGGVERVLVREVNILGILPPQSARPKEDLPPLMLPAMTATGSTALVPRKTTAVSVKKEAPKRIVKKAAKKKGQGSGVKGPGTAKKKTVKKTARNKTVKKAAGKPKKAASKKTASKKSKKKR